MIRYREAKDIDGQLLEKRGVVTEMSELLWEVVPVDGQGPELMNVGDYQGKRLSDGYTITEVGLQ
jgi:hypothetical protein